MKRTLVLIIPMLLVLSAACSRHATYGRPTPRDTLPTTKEPDNLKPPRKGSTLPPRSAEDPAEESACCVLDSSFSA